MRWRELFERAAAFETTPEEVNATLAALRDRER